MGGVCAGFLDNFRTERAFFAFRPPCVDLAVGYIKRFACEGSTGASVAQPAEQLICNQQVVGSSPSASLQWGGFPEWSKGSDCKSDGNAFEGSNPSPPIENARNEIMTAWIVTMSAMRV